VDLDDLHEEIEHGSRPIVIMSPDANNKPRLAINKHVDALAHVLTSE
jgi:hypothetical protein